MEQNLLDTEIAEKPKVSKKDIQRILEKDELNFWDVKCLFEYVDQALNGKKTDGGLAYFSSVSKQVIDDVEYAIKRTKEIAATIVKLEQSIVEQLDLAYQNTEHHFAEFYSKVSALQRKANESKLNLPELRIPYGWGDMVKLLDTLTHMPEEKRKIFYELAERFAVK